MDPITDEITATFSSEELEEIQGALEGDSNDAEHDALFMVADKLGLECSGPHY